MSVIKLIKSLKDDYNMFQTRELPSVAEISYEDLDEIASITSYDNYVLKTRDYSKNFIWHVASPKSGSTWLTNTIVKILNNNNYSTANLYKGGGNRLQDLEISEIVRLKVIKNNIFSPHQHCLCSDYVINLVKN